jgi:ribosomal protein L16 Arg81 hydroxylase
MFEQPMKPGDVLYLPRGQYHDALATSGASLHVTFSVVPVRGLALFNILERIALADSRFRDDLPAPTTPEGRAALAERLALFGDHIRDLLRDPQTLESVIAVQRARVRPRLEPELVPGDAAGGPPKAR